MIDEYRRRVKNLFPETLVTQFDLGEERVYLGMQIRGAGGSDLQQEGHHFFLELGKVL